jgi:hypothetical protein
LLDEWGRCGYVGWADAESLTETLRRALRETTLEQRRIRAAGNSARVHSMHGQHRGARGALGLGDAEGDRQLSRLRRADSGPVARWLGRIKAAAALVNAELGLLGEDKAERIAAAATRIASGELDDQFPIDVFQTGSGTPRT